VNYRTWVGLEADERGWQLHLDDTRRLDQSLSVYAQTLYDWGRPVSELGGILRALTNSYRWLKRQLPHAQSCLRAWEAERPAQCHRPMPALGLLAGVAVALTWDWPDIALMLLVAFDGCLRPSDFLQLRRRDFRLPSDLASAQSEAYVVLEASSDGGVVAGPKTRFVAARRQQVKLVDPLLVAALERHWGPRGRDDFIFACAAKKSLVEHRFRVAFDAIFRELGFSVRDGIGVTPASLRAGGATHLYQTTEDLALVRWRGRWTEDSSLEHYVQEMAAAELMSSLTPAVRRRVSALAAAAPGLVVRRFLP